jgi:hypothetical protein
MHRSGTSALAGLLVRLGAHAPTTLMQPNEHNPLGFWESDAFFEFHERLLQAGGTAWDLWTRFSPSGLDAAIVAQFGEEFRTLFQQEFDSAPLCVIKDPRMCRFVPFWLSHLTANNIDASPILMVRSPVEVARSLAARDGLGFEHALLLWLRHVLDAESDTRATRRSIIRYGDLLADWKAAAHTISTDIGVEWPGRSDTIDAEIATFLRPDLRHHALGVEAVEVAWPLSEWVMRTQTAFDILLERDADRTSEAFRILDEIRQSFDMASGLFGSTLDTERQRHVRLASTLEADLSKLRQHALSVETERDDLRRHATGIETQRDQLRQHASSLEVELRDLRHHASHLETELYQLEQGRDRLAVELAQTREDLGSTLTSLSQSLETTEKRVQSLEESRSWRWSAPLRAAFGVWLSIRSRVAK